MPISNPYRRQRLSWIPSFLDTIARGAAVVEACRIAGVTPAPVYHQRRTNEEFRASWDEAAEVGTILLEQEAQRRAYHGTEKPVFYKGEQCGSVQEYSDTLLMFMLRARRPDVYREKFDPAERGATVNVHIQAVRAEAVNILNQLFDDQSIGIGQLDPLTLTGTTGDGGHGGEVAAGPAPESDQHYLGNGMADPEQ